MGGSSKKVTVGYKYYLGMHLILCHGPVDKISRIRVDGRDAWVGNRREGRININKPGLFGGESREGGVSGPLDFAPGLPTQGVNDYLASKLGSLVPAFRGVVGVVLRQMYIGMNPYLKKWDFRLTRVMTRQDGIPQWYPATALIPTAASFKSRQRILLALDVTNSMGASVGGGATRLTVMKEAIIRVLDELKLGVADAAGVPTDITVAAFSTGFPGERAYINVTPAELDSLKAYVNGLRLSGGTEFTGVFDYANAWFRWNDGTSRDVMVIVTDGEPYPTSNFPATLTAGAAIINRTAPFDGDKEVDVFVINIDEGNTSFSRQMDNTPQDGVPVISGADSEALYTAVFGALLGNSPAMNVVHAVRECLTDPNWGMGYNESDIDEASFRAAALRLRQERIGVCLLWDRQKPIQDIIQELLKHADAALYVDRKTGLFTIQLIRDGYNPATLLHLTEENIVKIENFSRPTFGELTTAVTVNYWDILTGKNASVRVEDIALASMQQANIETTLQYPGLPDANMASRVAQRNLRVLSSQLARCTIYADRSAKDVTVGQPIKVTWPDYDLDGVVFRVAEVAYGNGRSNRIKLTVMEDVFGTPDTASVAPSPPIWENPSQAPAQITRQVAFEVPYLELVQRQGQLVVDTVLNDNPGAGYVGTAAGSPGGSTINARAYLDDGTGYLDSGLVDFCPTALLATAVDEMATTFSIASGTDLDLITNGTWFQIDNELCSVVSRVDNTLTVKRGVLDSVVRPHSAGATLFFWDEFSLVDDTEYVTSEQVLVQLASVSGSGEVAGTPMAVDLAGRAARPYPPADMKINGSYFPAETIFSDFTVSWVGRNRLQQTGGALIGFTDSHIAPEAGTTYELDIYMEPAGALLNTVTGLAGPSHTVLAADYPAETRLRIELFSKRGGLRSLHGQRHTFDFDSGVSLIDTIIGATPTVNQNTASLSMAVPAGAQSGDKLFVVLRCRVDRSFTVPAGWTTHLSVAIPSGSSGTSDTRVYILSKDWASETSVAFTQSVAAACSGMVVLLRGQLGVVASSATSPLSYTKTSTGSCMLVLTLDNGYPVVSGTAPRVSSPAGYSRLGYSYILSTTHFYGIFADKKAFEPAGALSLVISWPGSTTNQRLVVAVEVKQP